MTYSSKNCHHQSGKAATLLCNRSWISALDITTVKCFHLFMTAGKPETYQIEFSYLHPSCFSHRLCSSSARPWTWRDSRNPFTTALWKHERFLTWSSRFLRSWLIIFIKRNSYAFLNRDHIAWIVLYRKL